MVCCGYKGVVIKEWFANYYRNLSDLTIDLRKNEMTATTTVAAEPWRVTLVDTGDDDDDRRPLAAGRATSSATRRSA